MEHFVYTCRLENFNIYLSNPSINIFTCLLLDLNTIMHVLSSNTTFSAFNTAIYSLNTIFQYFNTLIYSFNTRFQSFNASPEFEPIIQIFIAWNTSFTLVGSKISIFTFQTLR